MKTIVLVFSMFAALPSFAASQDLKKCRGSFVVSCDQASKGNVSAILTAASRTGLLSSKSVSRDSIFQVQAMNSSVVAQATSVMEVVSQLNGVIVECDSSLGF